MVLLCQWDLWILLNIPDIIANRFPNKIIKYQTFTCSSLYKNISLLLHFPESTLTKTPPMMKFLWAIFLFLVKYESALCYNLVQKETKPLQQQTLTSDGGNTRNLNFLESTYDPGDGKCQRKIHTEKIYLINVFYLYLHLNLRLL